VGNSPYSPREGLEKLVLFITSTVNGRSKGTFFEGGKTVLFMTETQTSKGGALRRKNLTPLQREEWTHGEKERKPERVEGRLSVLSHLRGEV